VVENERFGDACGGGDGAEGRALVAVQRVEPRRAALDALARAGFDARGRHRRAGTGDRTHGARNRIGTEVRLTDWSV